MGEASGRSIKILSTRSPLFPNSLESASVANFRVLKEIISFHPVRTHEKSCLIAVIDDANSEIHAEFFPSESTLGCMKVLQDFICKNGIFKVLYVDKAGIFAGAKRLHFSQVSRACKDLGIELIFANSPEAKGRIERAFGTLQDRLVAELEFENIISMKEANNYLQQKFIPGYWNKNLTVEPEDPISSYRPIPKDIIVRAEYNFIDLKQLPIE